MPWRGKSLLPLFPETPNNTSGNQPFITYSYPLGGILTDELVKMLETQFHAVVIVFDA
jgi:hypothetical protein